MLDVQNQEYRKNNKILYYNTTLPETRLSNSDRFRQYIYAYMCVYELNAYICEYE